MNKETSESLLEASRLIVEAESTGIDCSVLKEDLNKELSSYRTNIDVLEAMNNQGDVNAYEHDIQVRTNMESQKYPTD